MGKKLSALDEAIAVLPKVREIVMPPHGFTVEELSGRMCIGQTTARKMVIAAVNAGKLVCLGKRPGHGGVNVYEVIKKRG